MKTLLLAAAIATMASTVARADFGAQLRDLNPLERLDPDKGMQIFANPNQVKIIVYADARANTKKFVKIRHTKTSTSRGDSHTYTTIIGVSTMAYLEYCQPNQPTCQLKGDFNIGMADELEGKFASNSQEVLDKENALLLELQKSPIYLDIMQKNRLTANIVLQNDGIFSIRPLLKDLAAWTADCARAEIVDSYHSAVKGTIYGVNRAGGAASGTMGDLMNGIGNLFLRKGKAYKDEAKDLNKPPQK